MKSSLMIAMMAGAAIATGAYAQKTVSVKSNGRHAKPVHQLAGHGNKVDPIRVAGVREISPGRWVMTTPWIQYASLQNHTDQDTVPAFDCFEPDATGAPTNFCSSGCTQGGNCPAAGPDSRWYFGLAYLNPDPTNDMTVVAGAEGKNSTRAEFAWNWGPTVPTECVVLLATFEDFNECGSSTGGGSNALTGIVSDFGPLAGGAGYFYSDVDVSADPTLFWTLPADGSGAYQLAYGTAFDPTTGTFTLDLTLGTQPMLWGCGADETPPDGRVGTQGPTQWDDDNPADGMYDPALECYDYTQTGDFCPHVWGAMVMFYVDSLNGGGSSCYANCDQSTAVPFLNVNDFICFQTRFAAGDSYANCDHSTNPPVLNVNDFLCFLSSFAAGCSAP